jgi:hypothetical protein
MSPGILINLKCDIFRLNSIFIPELVIKFVGFQKKSNSHQLESCFLGVQEPKILILDPGLYCKRLTVNF